ncbi:hypothetical protein GRF29_8g3352251 [Pseudopithomyces chartarum]|uniref:Uncharacterized protein n=1 Tax=Pseudopithomyces chartarum TaxID=1892770 RepID=A0AAN6M8I8_9PLEO|nr:hypothetical protein GRF29_8g3352251 [Pseudopithomyces chartarum]
MEPPLKRIRLDAQPGILTCIDALCASKGSILRETMLELLTLDPNVETIIRQNYDFLTDKPTDMADVNFDHYAKDLWRKIQRPYTGFQVEEDDDRDEYDIISEQILDWLRAVVSIIRDQSKGDDVSYATKRSALLTLCKIAKIICVSDGEGDQDGGTAVGDWVQEKFMQMNAGPWVYDVIRDIITTLSAQERDDMCREKAGRVTLMERMEELDILARSTDLGLAGEDGTFAELLGGYPRI